MTKRYVFYKSKIDFTKFDCHRVEDTTVNGKSVKMYYFENVTDINIVLEIIFLLEKYNWLKNSRKYLGTDIYNPTSNMIEYSAPYEKFDWKLIDNNFYGNSILM